MYYIKDKLTRLCTIFRSKGGNMNKKEIDILSKFYRVFGTQMEAVDLKWLIVKYMELDYLDIKDETKEMKSSLIRLAMHVKTRRSIYEYDLQEYL